MSCADWLKLFLTKGGNCVLCDIVREEALKQGFSRKDLRDARKELGVKTYHMFDDVGELPTWFWYREKEGDV